MNLPTSEPLPPEPEPQAVGPQPSPRTRSTPKGRNWEARLENLQHQLSAGFDFYLAALLCALLLGIAFVSDTPVMYFMALLVSPFLGPVFGALLVVFGGTTAFLLNTLGGLLFIGAATLGAGAVSGWLQTMLSPGWQPALIGFYGRWGGLEWVITALGSALITFLLARVPRQRPLVVNLVLAYGLLLPLGVAGYGWGGHKPELFTSGIRTAGLHLFTIWFVSWCTFLALRWRPRVWGYGLGVILLVGIVGLSNIIPGVPVQNHPKSVLTPTGTTAVLLQPTATLSPRPLATQTPLPSTPTTEATLKSSLTPSATFTSVPTPVWARVAARVGGGAFVRESPNGQVLTSLLNETLVQVISDPVAGEGGVLWVKIRTQQGVEGWIMQSLLATATPMPAW
ncbi:MAG: SH3 domain-containing protein [Thermanaerothrix sp.]|uniref:SH3 domain-containing protein n=1 Tax=Thermanaerothrix sp. TaxID=2972675 RepID=UPI003C7CE5FB